ncbi:MAG TPA: hypothetical protein VMV10_28430 [Pirellulales bacterium]|nr:hypothetical protein [Pirellulales bacterium]
MSGPGSASLESAGSASLSGKRREFSGAALKAPSEDRAAIIAPPLAEAEELIAAGAKLRRESNYDVQGRTLMSLAAEARCELISAARRYTSSYRNVAAAKCEPLLLAGHQPQLFHPGVWFKNFALARLARERQAAAVNLVIDSDTLKEAALRVPSGTLDDPVRAVLPFDDPAEEIPYEHRALANRELFADFGRRAQQAMATIVPDPLIGEFWPRVVARSRETSNLGECLSQARHQLEGDWGLETLELPQSQVCRLGAFHWFVAHLLAQLPRFQEIHNDALAEYRRQYRLRSANHPVPDLAAERDWLEAPFWLWTVDRPQRRHMFVRASGDEMIVSDRGQIEFRLPLAPEGDARRAVDVLADLPSRGICLRTRALTTTMFARLFLGDLFVHGIGGGLYDQLTDALVRRFFGFEPPPFMVLSATMLLPIERAGSAAEGLRETNRRLREFDYHPERFLAPEANAPEIAAAMAAKRRWIETPQTPANARERCRAIRAANESLARSLEPERRRAQADRERLSRRSRAESVLSWREYAFCLYPKRTLADFLLAFWAAKP